MVERSQENTKDLLGILTSRKGEQAVFVLILAFNSDFDYRDKHIHSFIFVLFKSFILLSRNMSNFKQNTNCQIYSSEEVFWNGQFYYLEVVACPLNLLYRWILSTTGILWVLILVALKSGSRQRFQCLKQWVSAAQTFMY